jgi:hypothetical protein
LQQIDSGTIAGGSVLFQSIINVIPQIIYRGKKYVNIDTVLSGLYGFPDTDLTDTLLVIIQSETHLLAYIITPILMLFMLSLARSSILNNYNNKIFVLSVLGFIFVCISQIETTLDTLLSSVRDIILIYIVSSMLIKIRASILRNN